MFQTYYIFDPFKSKYGITRDKMIFLVTNYSNKQYVSLAASLCFEEGSYLPTVHADSEETHEVIIYRQLSRKFFRT
jgi:hypothetical protein